MQTRSRAELLAMLNAPDRLKNLELLVREVREGKQPAPQTGRDVNNHIHTQYSFSPYSPTAAAYFAWQAGLCTAGIIDHDSVSGALEFLRACEMVGIAGTVGIECRVNFAGTPFEHRNVNNPDQAGIIYTTIHGIPRNKLDEVNAFFAPYRERRNLRNRKMVDGVNRLMSAYGMQIDFDRDVLPLSRAAEGGGVTERHISFALAGKMLEKLGPGAPLVSFIRNTLELPLSEKVEGYLVQADNPERAYDLLGWIKAELIGRFYISATDECPKESEVLALSEGIHAISAYPYLGDVGDSITGDKRAQKFEDDFLPELMDYIAKAGYRGVTYMPSRNTRAQLDRLRALCRRYGFFQISGEDINSPRQPFVCMAQRDAAFDNLYDSTWALIAHEQLVMEDPQKGFFSDKMISAYPDVEARIRAFAKKALEWRGKGDARG
jgi:hypothetical protein